MSRETETTARCPICNQPILSFWDGLWHGLGFFVPCLHRWLHLSDYDDAKREAIARIVSEVGRD